MIPIPRKYFVTKVERVTDDGEFAITAKAKSDVEGKNARSTLIVSTRLPNEFPLGSRVVPYFMLADSE